MPNNNIMIVEDEKIVAEDIRASVKKMGYSVCAMATTGVEAIEKAELMRPGLILMDIVLKGNMDGIEAASQIKERYKIPIVYLTAFGDDKVVQRAKIAEPYGYITKPFRDRDLQIAIEIALYKKQAESRIQKMEHWLATVLRSVGDAVIVSDKDRQITFMNEIAEKLTGWNKEDALGRKLTEILHIKDHDLHDLEKHLVEKVITNGLIINLIEDRLLITKDGKELPISDSAAPIKEDNGETPGTVIVFRDITASKQAEEERQNLEERLNRAEKMEALGLLAGGVAHDLNNVLGIVVGYAELVLMEAGANSSIRPQLMHIMNGGQKAAAIVDDLLTLARRGVSGREVLNLNRRIYEFKKSPELEKLLSYHPHLQIQTDLGTALLNISGSSAHLNSVLYNLISNAAESMPEGGCVTIKTTNQYLDKPIHGYDKISEGDYVVLSVSDTGEGISEANLKHIFEPFYTKKKMGRSGTGLGLAVVWGTVKDHHGYINVESETGQGTIFTLYFPVTREDIIVKAPSLSMSEYMGKGESILIVDDVKEQRDLAAGMLSSLNYKASSVSCGEEAVAYLKDHPADILVLDMIMDPGMDGLDTYKSILKIRPDQKAIIVSGYSESERVHDAQALGAGEYVKKPYVIEKLGLAVKKELARL